MKVHVLVDKDDDVMARELCPVVERRTGRCEAVTGVVDWDVVDIDLPGVGREGTIEALLPYVWVVKDTDDRDSRDLFHFISHMQTPLAVKSQPTP